MQLITEMALPSLPIEDPAFHRDPMPYVEAARQLHPWLARFSSGYVVHGYQALKDLAFMDDKLEMGLDGIVEFYQAHGTPWAGFMNGMLNSTTGADHKRLRASIASAFTPRAANLVRPLMRQVINQLLDEWIPKREFDFAEFAAYFPVTVLCGVLGVSSEPIPRLRTAIESHMASLTLNKAIVPEFMAAYDTLWKFTDDLILEREQQHRSSNADADGLLDALIIARNAGNMSDTELRYMLLVLLIGGYDTSKNMLTLTVHRLMQHPDYWARCAQDVTFCSKVIEEMLRHTTIATLFRNVKQSFDYAEHRFPKDVLVTFAVPLANRDPAIYTEPMKFDPERLVDEQHRHLGFGRGVHICPGQFLARAQLQEGLHLITQRIPHPRQTGDVGWRPFLGAWGLSTLPFAVE